MVRVFVCAVGAFGDIQTGFYLADILANVYNVSDQSSLKKPFVNTSAAAQKLIDLAKAKGKVLTAFHSMCNSLP